MKTFTVKSACNLKDFTDFTYPQGSFCLARLLKNRDVKINGERVTKNVALHSGDEVTYYTTQKQEEKLSHYIAFEDENILVADKLSGVSSEGLLSELSQNGEVYAIHRLDRNTEGLIAFAKNRDTESALLSAFKVRRVKKTYLALCKNNFKEREATLVSYLVKDEKSALVKVYDKEVKNSVKIITEYKVIGQERDLALVEICLQTGKTHQIRAHMAYIGCPVAGDEKYGDRRLNKMYGVRRQCLVAKRLKFMLSGELSYLNEKQIESRFNPEVRK